MDDVRAAIARAALTQVDPLELGSSLARKIESDQASRELTRGRGHPPGRIRSGFLAFVSCVASQYPPGFGGIGSKPFWSER
jgi:hypothetical protein